MLPLSTNEVIFSKTCASVKLFKTPLDGCSILLPPVPCKSVELTQLLPFHFKTSPVFTDDISTFPMSLSKFIVVPCASADGSHFDVVLFHFNT